MVLSLFRYFIFGDVALYILAVVGHVGINQFFVMEWLCFLQQVPSGTTHHAFLFYLYTHPDSNYEGNNSKFMILYVPRDALKERLLHVWMSTRMTIYKLIAELATG